MKGKWSSVIIIASFLTACGPSRRATAKDDGKIEMVFVQVNDVYEIAPIEGGKVGGMARVATLKQAYQSGNPNTFLLMAGDFLSPSLYNSLQYQGKRIRGKQMVESMNAAGVDLAVFGNHEFDINEGELQERINESAFQWVASNVYERTNGAQHPFRKINGRDSANIPEHYILHVRDADGTNARIGFIGITLPANRSAYVGYKDQLATARMVYDQIKDSCDAVIALTHQTIADDIQLAEQLPGLALIVGGHEHNMQFQKRGNIYITKAHSNARSAYVLKVTIDKTTKRVDVVPSLRYISDSIAADPRTDSVVRKWTRIAEENYATLGFNPDQVLLASGDSLEGRETETRNHPTNLTDLIVSGIAYACPEADAVIFNSGSIRVDDVLKMPVTQYDILRTLPFGGGIREADMKGRLLTRILNAGNANRNSGGFLLYGSIAWDSTNRSWKWKGQPIEDEKVYRVAVTDYLFAGLEQNLDFLNEKNPDILKVYPAETSPASPKSDIRLAIIRYLQNKK